jgi:predicted nucleic acid-binding protein
MIYLDTAYIVKCYIHEPGSYEVRHLLQRQMAGASSALARIEFTTSVLRAVREGRIDAKVIPTIFTVLAEDEQSGLWTWLPLSAKLMEDAIRSLRTIVPVNTPLRAGDAIHLACARENGFAQIYTNDRHLIAAAPHFGISAVNVIP